MNETSDKQSFEIQRLNDEIYQLKRQNTELTRTGFDLISTQTKLQSVLHNASDGIISFASDGTVESVNSSAQQIFGYSEEEIVSHQIPNLIPCPDWVENNVPAYIEYFLKSRATPELPLIGKHKMGFDIQLNVSIAQTSKNHTLLFKNRRQDKHAIASDLENHAQDTARNDSTVCFFRDITLNKKLEKDLADQKHALDLAAAIIIRDKDFRVIDVNDKLCQTLGRNRNEFLGEQYIQTKFGAPAKVEIELNKIREFLSQGNPWVGETLFMSLKGDPIWFTESTTPFLDKNNVPYQYLSILFDITDRKIFESQLEQHRDNLQHLVDIQVNDIRNARDDANFANQAKSEFLANISHELRTPLHGIISFTQLSLKQFKTLPLDESRTSKLEKFIGNIELTSQRLLLLLNDLLDLSKLETGKEKFNPERINLYELIRQIHDEYSAKILEKQIEFILIKPDKPIFSICDKQKVLQIFSNLMSNAIKFSPEQKSIVVHIEKDETVLGRRSTDTKKTKGVTFTITDQGPGIPDHELTAIFDKFYQSSTTKSGAGGTGLGLSISQEIASAHQGKIWAEHNPKGGAVFKLFLPDV